MVVTVGRREKKQRIINRLMASARDCRDRGDMVGCGYFFEVAKALCAEYQ